MANISNHHLLSKECVREVLLSNSAIPLEDIRQIKFAINKEIAKELLQSGRELSSLSKNLLLLWASENGVIELIPELLALGADISYQDKYGTTALHHIARHKHADEIFKQLWCNDREKLCQVLNIVDRDNFSPRAIALDTFRQNKEIMPLLSST